MMNAKKRLLAGILAAGTILTFSGCTEREDDNSTTHDIATNDTTSKSIESNVDRDDDSISDSDSISISNSGSDNASKSDGDSKPETSVLTDLQAMSKLENMTSCDIDVEIEMSGMILDADAAISYDKADNLAAIDLESLSAKIPGDDMTEPQEIKIGRSDILVDMTDKTGYVGLSLVYDFMAMSGEDPEEVRAQFESAYPNAEYMKVDLSDSIDDITGSANIDTTVTAPGGISEEDLKAWFETSCKSVLEKYLKPVESDFDNSRAPAGMHGLVFNNANIVKLLSTCDDMVSSKDFKDGMFKLYEMSTDKDSIEALKSEYDANLDECKDFIEQAVDFLSDETMDNKIDFEIATSVSDDSARFVLSGDFDIVDVSNNNPDFDDFDTSDFDSASIQVLPTNDATMVITGSENAVTRMQASFDIDIDVSTKPVDLSVPEIEKYIDTTSAGDPGLDPTVQA